MPSALTVLGSSSGDVVTPTGAEDHGGETADRPARQAKKMAEALLQNAS